MPNLIFLVNNYENSSAIDNVVNYIVKSDYLDSTGNVGCYLLPGMDISECVHNAFISTKKVMGKEDGKLVQHIIVGFGDIPNMYIQDVNRFAHAIACYYAGQGYQVFWGSHFGSDHLDSYPHIHIVVNTINTVTGARFVVTNDTMNELKQFLVKICPTFHWSYEAKPSYFKEIA